MTSQQRILEIQRILNSAPDELVQEVYDYLNAFQNKSQAEIDRVKDLKRILHEDRELLKKLAE